MARYIYVYIILIDQLQNLLYNPKQAWNGRQICIFYTALLYTQVTAMLPQQYSQIMFDQAAQPTLPRPCCTLTDSSAQAILHSQLCPGHTAQPAMPRPCCTTLLRSCCTASSAQAILHNSAQTIRHNSAQIILHSQLCPGHTAQLCPDHATQLCSDHAAQPTQPTVTVLAATCWLSDC